MIKSIERKVNERMDRSLIIRSWFWEDLSIATSDWGFHKKFDFVLDLNLMRKYLKSYPVLIRFVVFM